MKTAKMVSWLLVVIMLMGCMIFPASAEGEMRLESIVGIENETVWIHTSVGLVPFGKDGMQTGEALYPDADAYAVGPDGHIYYSIAGDVFKFDRDGNKIDEWNTPLEGFTKILVNNTYILVMGDTGLGTIHAKNHILVGAAADGLCDISFYGENSFLLTDGIGASIMDCSTLDELEWAPVSLFGKILKSSEADGIYLYSAGTITYRPFLSETDENYMLLSNKDDIQDVFLGEKLVYAIQENTLQIFPLPVKAEDKKEITIIGGLVRNTDMRFTHALEIFKQRHPEYTVKLTDFIDDTKLNTALMANEPGYDILALPYTTSVVQYKENMFLDLSENRVIADNLAQLLEMPFLWESDGSLYGIPMLAGPYGFKITTALWNEIGANISQNWTWDDFFALADVAKELGLKLINDNENWLTMRTQYESMYVDYIAGEANYDTDAFRDLVTQWKLLDDEGMISYGYGGNVLLEAEYLAINGSERGYVYLGMPTLDGEHITPILLDGLYINRYSEHVEAAVEFMEIFTSLEVQNMTYAASSLFVEDVSVSPMYPLLQAMGIVPTEESMAQWRHFLKTGRLHEVIDGWNYGGMHDLISKLKSDKITVDEFIAEVQERADIMIGE